MPIPTHRPIGIGAFVVLSENRRIGAWLVSVSRRGEICPLTGRASRARGPVTQRPAWGRLNWRGITAPWGIPMVNPHWGVLI